MDSSISRREFGEYVDATSWQRSVPRQYWGVDLDLAPEAVQKWAHAVAAGTETANLVLAGPVGVGKTWAGLAAIRWIRRQGRINPPLSATWYRTRDMLRRLRPEGGLYLHQLVRPTVLMLDDLYTTEFSRFDHEMLLDVFDRRSAMGVPTIVTVNVDGDALRGLLGDQTYDRIREDATVVFMRGQSRRTAPRQVIEA